MTAALVIGLVLAVGAVLALISADARPGPETTTTWYRPLSSAARRHSLRGEVLFARREGPRQVALDCLIDARVVTGGPYDDSLSSGAPAPARQPVHVRASGAYLWGIDTCLSDVVVDWVAEGRRVPVEIISEGPHKARLRATTDKSVAVLEVCDYGGVERQLARLPSAA